MFSHDYPYTDFHELNIDWLLNEWKKFLNEYEDVRNRVTTVEEAMVSLRDFVNNYFDNLDVQEEINNKLDAMKEDGSLEVLLQAVVDTAQVMTLNTALSVSMYRGVADQNDESTHPSFLQAACVNNGIAYLFFMNPRVQGDGIGRSYALASGQLLSEVALTGVDHANGADYYDGYLYLATLTGNIIKFDTNFVAQETYTFDVGFRSISFDNDGTCYAASGNKLYTVDLENNAYTVAATLDIVNEAWQSGIVRDGWLYEAGLNPSCLYRVNVATGLTSKVYPIDRYVDVYCVGEVESVAQDRATGKFYIVSCSYYNYANYRNGNLFEADFNSNLAPVRRYSGGSVLSVGGLYVGTNTNGKPDGSQGNPFPNLMSALMAYNSPACETFKTFQILLDKDCPDEVLYLRNNTLRLLGYGHSIGSIYAVGCNLELTNVIIRKPNGEYTSNPSSNPVYCNSCVIDFDGVTINESSTVDYSYAGVFNECIGTIFSLINNTTKDISFYRSNILTNPGARTGIYYEAQSMQNYFVTPSGAGQMTAAEINNTAYAAYVLVRVSKDGKSAVAIFTPATTATSLVTLYVRGALEFHDIRQTYDADNGGYTYTDTQARALSGVDSAGTVSVVETDAVTINNVLFVSRWT